MSSHRGLATIFMILSCAASQPVLCAQDDWAGGLVDQKKLDFGVVATGSSAVRTITVTNGLNTQVHIAQVTTACRCAEAGRPSKTLLQPGEKSTISVSINTRSFRQQRDTALTIVFDAPQFAEVRIPVSVYIRTDVVLDPGKADFGAVDEGSSASRKLQISYAGRPEWKILEVRSQNKSLVTTVTEKKREVTPADGINVLYELDVRLASDMPQGRILEYLTLVTDDAANPYVPVLVEGRVVPDIVISNPSISLRTIPAGQEVVASLVIKGNRPFAVESVDFGTMTEFFRTEVSQDNAKLHVLKLTFRTASGEGRFVQPMSVKIRGRKQPLPFTVSGTVVAPNSNSR